MKLQFDQAIGMLLDFKDTLFLSLEYLQIIIHNTQYSLLTYSVTCSSDEMSSHNFVRFG